MREQIDCQDNLSQGNPCVPAAELYNLEAHLLQCAQCEAEECFFDRLFAELADLPMLEAPADFEYTVMTRIIHLDEDSCAVELRVWDKARSSLVGTILLVLGAGTVYVFFKDPIRTALTAHAAAPKLLGAAGLRAGHMGGHPGLRRTIRLLAGLAGLVGALLVALSAKDNKGERA